MQELSLHTIDLTMIACYFIVVFAIGIYVAKKTETGDDLFLAGRSLGFFPIGFSLFASNLSSTTLIGLSGAAYASGISVSNYEWMAGIVLVFMSFHFIPIYLNSSIHTIPGFLKKRFGGISDKYFSFLTIFLSIMVDTAGGLYAGAIVLKTFFPSFDLHITCAVLAIVTGVYTAVGGLKAVVYTDVIQAIVLIIGCSLLTYFMFGRYDFDWEAVKASVPSGHLSLIRPINDPQLPWLGTLIGVPILGFWYWATNQYITQRLLGARDVSHARWGAMLGGALKLLPLFIMVIPGALAIKFFPNLPNPDMVFPTLVAKILPIGITGLVLSGLIAAIMSSIDSTLNSASTLIVYDFILAKDPNVAGDKIAQYGRITTIVLMIIAAVWAPMIANFGGLFDYLQQSFSILVPPVATIFLLGIFSKHGGKKTSIGTLLLGHVLGILLFTLGQIGVITIHYTIIAGFSTLVCFGLFYLLANFFNEKNQQPDELKASAKTTAPMKQYPWYLDYRIQAGVIITITAVMVLSFW